MERSEQFESASICSQLNLKVDDLNIECLMGNPTYRRLYNIVVYDTNKTQYQYRKNLIKQLYFLLKITPIMKPQLQQSYLQKLQRWYNKNDHKKTQLGSGRLRNIMQEYVTTKQSFSNHIQAVRPQSGVNWNKNVAPFLRPYTAKRPTNSRPQSYKSKFGQSTKADTKIQSETEITIREFALSIKEQLQISKDFLNKNRTIHPESQPIYQQLFNIISKAGIGTKFNRNQQDDQENEILFQRDREEFFAQNQADIKDVQPQEQNVQKDSLPNDQLQQFEKVSQQSEKDEDDEDRQKDEQQNFEKKIYTRDINISRNQKKVDGFFHLANENQIDTIILKKANNKYLHLTDNKFINYSKDDHQMVRNYVNYSRVKSAMKKEFNRKSQTKRLLSAKTRSNTNLSVGQQQSNPRVYSAFPRREYSSVTRNSAKPELITSPKTRVFDFSSIHNKENSFVHSSQNYNQRKELDHLYRQPIEQYKKMNKNNISTSEIKCNEKNLLTKYDCFLTREKINPIADVHVDRHNEEALEEIQKIKQKVAGLGKKWVSTDSLMKALYIDSYDTIGSCNNITQNNLTFLTNSTGTPNQTQKLPEQFNWKSRNIYFNMLSNGQKKMKKKTRKLKKK